jgi:2-keto-4-pentenoate hydratase/2-oxohepta-3-ene-1,7-dioic acid hydratase in catechol pathway
MKIIRYQDASGQVHHAAQSGEVNYRIEGDIFGEHRVTAQAAEIQTLLAPISPTGIWCIGLNYRHHAAESGAQVPENPVLFMKGINAVQHPGAPIVLPTQLRSDEVDYECELAVVIGTGNGGALCKNIRRADALDYVLGYTCANDVSARDWQIKKGGTQWSRGKPLIHFVRLVRALSHAMKYPTRIRWP